jgi:mono/diheme cytochrome c family protein
VSLRLDSPHEGSLDNGFGSPAFKLLAIRRQGILPTLKIKMLIFVKTPLMLTSNASKEARSGEDRMKVICIGVLISAVTIVWPPGVSYAQDKDRGQYWYSNYCASCHGQDGKGDGPVAKSLSRRPADLTRLSAANGGTFSSERIAEVIDGRREVAAHGTRDMPVWGRAVRFGPSIVRTRVRAIVGYVSTLQGK